MLVHGIIARRYVSVNWSMLKNPPPGLTHAAADDMLMRGFLCEHDPTKGVQCE